MMRPSRPLLAAAALYAALTLAVGWRVLFLGDTFLPSDFAESWRSGAPQESYRNPIHDDIGNFIYALESARDHALSTRVSGVFCGLPIAPDPQLRTFYPPRLLLYALFGPPRSIDFEILLHFFLAGLAFFALIRSLGLSPPAAAFGGVVWMLCGQQMAWFKYVGGPVAGSWLPLLALLLHRAAERKSFRLAAGAGLLWALLFSGTHPQLSYLALLWAAGYLAVRLPEDPKGILRLGAGFALFGAGAAAIQLFPFLYGLATSLKTEAPLAGSYLKPWRTPLMLATLVLPRIFGSPVDRAYVTSNAAGTNFFEWNGYMGILALLLAVRGIRREPLPRTALLLAGLNLAMATFHPVHVALKYVIPGMWLAGAHRLYLFAFGVAILAAFGAERMMAEPRKRWAWLCSISGGSLFLVSIVAESGVPRLRWLAISNGPTIAALLAFGAAAAWLHAPRPFPRLLAVAAVVDLLPFFIQYNPTYPVPKVPREESPYRFLDLRVTEYWKLGLWNYGLYAGAETPEGYAMLVPRRYGEMVRALGGAAGGAVDFAAPNEMTLALFGVARIRDADGAWRMNPRAFPRAWWVPHATGIADKEQRLKQLASLPFHTVVLLDHPVGVQSRKPGQKPAVKVAARTGTRLELETQSAEGYVVICESGPEGWSAVMDAAPVPVLSANHGLIAIRVPAGIHQIRLEYRPPGFLAGFGVTLMAVVAGLALLAFPARPAPGVTTA